MLKDNETNEANQAKCQYRYFCHKLLAAYKPLFGAVLDCTLSFVCQVQDGSSDYVDDLFAASSTPSPFHAIDSKPLAHCEDSHAYDGCE
jgi:hypothetical protein